MTSPLQADLAGFAPMRATDRLFLAIRPDPAAINRIVALVHDLRDRHGVRSRPLDVMRLHVTLQYFGEYAGLPQGLVTAIDGAVDAAGLRAFDLAFDRVASFDGARRPPCVLLGSQRGTARLHDAHAALGARLATDRVRATGQARFVPHLTLFYDDRALPEQEIEPIAWTVRELLLVDSLVGQGEHRVLRRWPLHDSAETQAGG